VDRAGELAERLLERVNVEAELVLPFHDASSWLLRASRSVRRSIPMIPTVATTRPRRRHEGEASITARKRA
jgi:hypothetical protein